MQQRQATKVDRWSAIDHLYKALTHMWRRRAELGASMHPELSLAGYTLLDEIETVPGTRATDLAALFGLEKSTVSRQLDCLEEDGFLRREGERRGRRGNALVVTDAGRAALGREAAIVRDRLSEAMAEWKIGEITSLADMVDRFIEDLS